MRSLQIRLPLLAVGVLAISLAFSAFVMFETLLLTGERRVDDNVERDTLRLREAIALTLPAALPGSNDPPPSAAEVMRVVAAYLERQDRSEETMTIARIGDDLLTTDDAPTRLELLRDQGALFDIVREAELDGQQTIGSSQGDLRVAVLQIRAADDDVTVLVAGSLTEVRATATRSLRRIGAAAGLGLLVAGGLLAFSIRRVLRPLNDLASAARNAELEQLGARVALPSGSDEVGQLAGEFNRMLDRLEGSVNDQRRFMASVSHELRTPITIARGHLELLDGDRSDDGDHVREIVELVRSELMIMQRLVADLMTLGRAGDDDFVILEPMRLRDFLDELHLRVVGLGTRGVRFEPVPDDTVLIDRDRLAQAVLNLVTNASLHALNHNRIVIGAQITADTLAVWVDDDGAGVQERLLGSLFEPFVRSETARGSTGLGLSVVKAVAEAHQGSVELVSSQHGTTVTILLPHLTPAAPTTGTAVGRTATSGRLRAPSHELRTASRR